MSILHLNNSEEIKESIAKKDMEQILGKKITNLVQEETLSSVVPKECTYNAPHAARIVNSACIEPLPVSCDDQ